MVQSKSDLRVIKTRKSIMQAFIQLSSDKDFKSITVKDITQEALINRATFYYHFSDIYDLLEKALAEELLINLNYEYFKDNPLNESTIVDIFKVVAEFQLSLNRRCHRSYPETIDHIVQEHIANVLYKLLADIDFEDDSTRQLAANMISASIYKAAETWYQKDSEMLPENYIKRITPYMISGLLAYD